jgi:phage replication-related protein YjqB (UPF0714/DUF867 family)
LKSAQANNSMRLYLKKPFPKIELVEWLKVKALSSSPSISKKKKKSYYHVTSASFDQEKTALQSSQENDIWLLFL